MQAGLLRHRVTFESRPMVSDEDGAASGTWTPVASVWAEIVGLGGRELIAAQALNAEISHRITVRFHPFLSDAVAAVGMRVRFKARVFNIHQALNVDEKNAEVVLLASEGMNQG